MSIDRSETLDTLDNLDTLATMHALEPASSPITDRTALPTTVSDARIEEATRARWHERVIEAVGIETALVLLVCAPILLLHASTFSTFFADDSLISLRYAQRLLDGQGLTWSDGTRVEGYTNLLWILCTALLGLFRVNLITAARILGALGSLAALAACARPVLHRGLRGAWPALAGGFVLAVASPVAVWVMGGLEQPLVAGLLAWAAVSCMDLLDTEPPSRRTVGAAAALLSLLVLTRPDGLLFSSMLVSVAALRFRSTAHRRALALIAGTVVGTVMLHHLFRGVYYRDFWPNTAYAKVALTSARVANGWTYVRHFLVTCWPLGVATILATILGLFSSRHRPRIVVLLTPLLLWLTYVTLVGGDIFPGRRHMIAALVLMALLLVEGLASLRRGPGLLRSMSFVGLAVLLPWFALRTFRDPEAQRARDEKFEWDGRPLGALLKRHFAASAPSVAVDSGGSLPYFSGLPSIDMLGLNDRYLAHNPPAGFGKGEVGHELGSGTYILSRSPDLVVFNLPAGEEKPKFLSGKQMVTDVRFTSKYRMIELDAPDTEGSAHALVYARLDSAKLGFSRTKTAVHIPGFFLATQRGTVASEDSQGRLGSVLQDNKPVVTDLGTLDAGTWVIRADSSGAPLRLMATGAGVSAEGTGGLEITLRTATAVKLSLVPVGGLLSHVRAIDAER